MKQTLYIIAFCCAALFFGCSGEDNSPISEETREKTRVKLSGSLPATGIITRSGDDERGEGMINPIPNTNGVPPSQLMVGIVTIEFGSFDNATPPTVAQWNNPTTYLDYGFFGGNIPYDKPDNYTDIGDSDDDDPERLVNTSWTGNIEYTNRAGDAIQQVFYDEMGIYYYLVVVYPYDFIYDIDNVEEDRENNKTVIWNNEGASVVFEVDGSQDIMASTMGSGNIEHPFTSSLSFSHKLTALRCHFAAESELAVERYGNILSVELIEQPERIGLNIGKQAAGMSDALFNAYPNVETDYPAVRSSEEELSLPYPPDDETPATPEEFGYILAMSAQSYTFRIITEKRNEDNPLYATYTFPEDGLPLAGTAYNLTFTMVETADIVLEAAVAEEWEFEQTFD